MVTVCARTWSNGGGKRGIPIVPSLVQFIQYLRLLPGNVLLLPDIPAQLIQLRFARTTRKSHRFPRIADDGALAVEFPEQVAVRRALLFAPEEPMSPQPISSPTMSRMFGLAGGGDAAGSEPAKRARGIINHRTAVILALFMVYSLKMCIPLTVT